MKEINYRILGRRIKEIRKRRNITQAELSEVIDKNPSFVSYIESGTRSMSLETLIQLANALQVSTDLLLIDHLDHLPRAAGKELTALLAESNEKEVIIVLETMKVLISALREHRT